MGKCDIQLQKHIDSFTKQLGEMLDTPSITTGENNVLIKELVKNAEDRLKRVAKAATSPSWPVERVVKESQDIIQKVRKDFNALVDISNRVSGMGKIARNIREIKAVVRVELNKIFTAKQLSRERFINYVDNIIEDVKTGGKNITDTQANDAKRLITEAMSGSGDEAISEYLKSKGIVEDLNSVMVKGLKQGTYTSDQANVTELDLLFKTLKKIENGVQDSVEAAIVGYERLKDHAFVAKFDSLRAAARSEDEFLAAAYDSRGKFIFDITKNTDESTEVIKLNQKMHMRNIYKKLITSDVNSANRQTNSLDRLFHDRNIKFIDDAAERHFFEMFADNSRGYFKSRLNHLAQQLDDVEMQKLVGSDARRWYAQLHNALEAAVRGRVTPDELQKFRGSFSEDDLMTAMGQGHKFSENMSALKQINQNYVQAARTPLSPIRQVIYDGSLHSAIIERSFDPKSGLLSGWMRNTASLIAYIIKQGFDKKQIIALGNMIEDNGISVHMARSEAMRRMYDPNLSPFQTHKGWLEGIRKYSESQANVVSRYGLADAVHRATRLNSSVRGGRLLMKMTEKDSGAAEFLLEHGFRKGEWDKIRQFVAKASHMGKEILFDVVKGVQDAPDDVIKGMRTGAENVEDTRRRLNNQIRQMQQTLVDDIGARPTLRTGINIHTNVKNPHFRLIHSLLFKFQGIALTQQQSLVRAIRRINGAQTLDPGVWGSGIGNPINLIKTGARPENLMINLEMMALIGAAGYMIEVGRALVSGKTPPEYTPDIVFKSILNSGALGVATMFAQNIQYGDSVVGTPVDPEARLVGDLVGGVEKGIEKGNWDSLKLATWKLTRTAVPASSLLLRQNTAFDFHVQKWLDISTAGIDRGLKNNNQELLFGK